MNGRYIGSAKANGEPLSLRELQEALAYVNSHRTAPAPFEVAFAGESPADGQQGATIVQPYASAGVTWWLEGIWTERGSLEQMRERIRQGPPQ